MAAAFTDKLTGYDKHGFRYEVTIEHHPELGTSIAYNHGLRIGQFEYGRYLLPQGDDDFEWEQFEERFRENAGGDSILYFEVYCKDYFDSH